MLLLIFVTAEETAHHRFNFFAAGRLPTQDGMHKLTEIVDANVKCNNGQESCARKLEVFKSSVTYKQLKKAEDYVAFCDALQVDNPGTQKEHGRMFYLSVPAFAYAGIAENIHKGNI